MKYYYSIIAGLILLVTQSVIASGVELVVHPDEKPHLLKLIERLGLNDMELVKDDRDEEEKKLTPFYREFGLYKDRYWFEGKHYKHLIIVTDFDDRIIRIKVKEISIKKLNEILNFKELISLQLHVTDIESLEGVEFLTRLKKLELVGSESLFDLNGLKNLKKLRYIDLDGATNLKDIGGISNLPSLEEFYCHSCSINNASSLGDSEKLERLKLGGDFKDISSLKSLKYLKYLYLDSENLQSFDVINEMPSLEEIFVWVGTAKSFNINKELPSLKYIHIVDNPIEHIPNLSKLPNLEKFTVTNSNLKYVDLPVSHEKIKVLQFKIARNLNRISPIKNMPKLEELAINKASIQNIEIGHLPSLKKLTLSGTDITEIKDFDHFPELTELWMTDTKVKDLEPLLDAPKLHRVILDKTARDIPNVSLILEVLRENMFAHHREGGPQNAREEFRKRLAEQQAEAEQVAEEKQGRAGRRSRN